MKFIYILSTALIFSFGLGDVQKPTEGGYNSDLVSFGKKTYAGTSFYVVKFKRKGERIKVKYFAKKLNGKSIQERYDAWSKNQKVIMYSSGAYMSESFDASTAGIVGLTLDNGIIINRNVVFNRLSALVVTYPNGTIEIKNINDGRLTFDGGGSPITYDFSKFNDVSRFIDWASESKLTVFQTHLLAHNKKMMVHSNGSYSQASRRFLVSGQDSRGSEFYFIVHRPDAITLYDGAKSVFDYLNNNRYTVNSMINLDTGAQDVFQFFSVSGNVSGVLQGGTHISNARNLMAFYYE